MSADIADLVLRKQGETLGTNECRLKLPSDYSTKHYLKRFIKPNPYTRQGKVQREELALETCWTGHEPRPGMEDLRPIVVERDGHICQMCDKPVTAHAYQVDHIRPVKRFKMPVEANRLENLWTLCTDCHKEKTKYDRQMESRMR